MKTTSSIVSAFKAQVCIYLHQKRPKPNISNPKYFQTETHLNSIPEGVETLVSVHVLLNLAIARGEHFTS